MHSGRFPERYSPAYDKNGPSEYPPPAAQMSRRQWFVAVLGGTTMASVTGYVVVQTLSGEVGAGSERIPVGPPQRGSLDWALWMAERPDDELLPAAGDMERVCMRFREEQRLVPGFVRVLEIALKSDAPEADTAGACAIRSLRRLGRFDLVGTRRDRILEREAFTEMNDTLTQLENAEEARKRRR